MPETRIYLDRYEERGAARYPFGSYIEVSFYSGGSETYFDLVGTLVIPPVDSAHETARHPVDVMDILDEDTIFEEIAGDIEHSRYGAGERI